MSGAWLDRYRAVLCDLDGCLISGETVLPGAGELVAAAGARLFIVSNNSTDTSETLSARLARLGLDLPAERLVLAGVTALEMLAREMPGGRVALFAAPALFAYAEATGLVLDDATPEVAVLARDTELTYPRLARLVRHAGAGVPLVVTNPDASHPAADGAPVPETGALLDAVRACLPDLEVRIIGKPETTLIDEALRRAGAAPEEALFIGDNPATDGAGAARAGLDFALIRGPSAKGTAGAQASRTLLDLLAARGPLTLAG
ncbi:MAG: HAD-IIA family hydrolase [Pseudomonadota bacterium]